MFSNHDLRELLSPFSVGQFPQRPPESTNSCGSFDHSNGLCPCIPYTPYSVTQTTLLHYSLGMAAFQIVLQHQGLWSAAHHPGQDPRHHLIPPQNQSHLPTSMRVRSLRKYPGMPRHVFLSVFRQFCLRRLYASIRFSIAQSLFSELLLYAICCHSFICFYLLIWFWVRWGNGRPMYRGREASWRGTLSRLVPVPTQLR